ncbi:4-(cytidine 5'-diphospho)-2-C-methyl-D-erythritol kinase [Campylobacter troglodytis]|uniref:4-(cytidine 5'-diphospho)-2-C-methyl-D-erythritol kinase n=1 Tax=Campylobacter troglodytis TaxID=654363 RepID=UPI001159EE72|nr:4-(cytidine 5'-diphospho)-2-C-methyl-D-erythritol kinase [Campylobacter troglodytis]TQR61162.1 4-(cytidine 5'-diphospho)-2-C-methyl-D-erythritol kinase [Campylobacter troglodytis]
MKANAKANIFLKITGFDGRRYHYIESRYVLLDELFDELELSKDKQKEGFEILSDFSCEDNILHKAYKLLCEEGFQNELEACFSQYSLKLDKKIPVGGGLGGGSSDGACFLRLMNENLNLKLSTERLMKLGARLGADVSFFLSGFKSANVSGIGQLIKEFDDELPRLNFTFPDLSCNTALVYEEFDKGAFDLKKSAILAKEFQNHTSKRLLEIKNTILNDLFTPCVSLYPKMSMFLQGNYFLSGSGSAVFKVDE